MSNITPERSNEARAPAFFLPCREALIPVSVILLIQDRDLNDSRPHFHEIRTFSNTIPHRFHVVDGHGAGMVWVEHLQFISSHANHSETALSYSGTGGRHQAP